MKKNLNLNTLSNFWILLDEDLRVVTCSSYFNRFISIGDSLLSDIVFIQPNVCTISTSTAKKWLKNIIIIIKIGDVKFRSTFHETEDGSFALLCWPVVKSFKEVVDHDLESLINHPGSQILDQLILKDIFENQKKHSIHVEKEKELSDEMRLLQEDFIANMSHEIRSPLNIVLGFMDILSEMDLNNEQQEIVKKVINVGGHLSDLVNQILDISKLESGMMTLDKDSFNILEAIKEVIDMNTSLIVKKNITFNFNHNETGNYLVQMDLMKFKQILQNIISNAVKFCFPNGKIDISLNIGKKVLVTVFNEGKKIAEERTEAIFDKFSQENQDISKNYGGSGVGLPLSKKLACLMGGDLYLDKNTDKGVTFAFELDYVSADIVDVPVEDTKADVQEKLRVLVIDDSEDNLEIMRLYLKQFVSFKVDLVTSGKSALERVCEQIYDVIFVDMNMPNMNGKETLVHIRSIEKEQNRERSHIVIISANAFKHHVEDMIQAGGNDFLAKPIRKKEFENYINDFLKRRAA